MCNRPDCDICHRLRIERLLRMYEVQGARRPTRIEASFGYLVVFDAPASGVGGSDG